MSDVQTANPPVVASPVMSAMARSLVAPQLGALLIVATALTLGIGLILWGMKPDFVPVSDQGNREDALQVIELLNSQQIEYKLDPSTGLVLVPRDQAAQVQMTLAAGGFNAGNRQVGLELLQQQPALGTSHFTESARYQHALEIELSRTISTMRNVESARVHLAIPKQSVFVRDREQASASVMIRPQTGRSIEQEQVNAVVNLVASSIPYLESGQVTVVDQWGRLLSTGDDSTSAATRDQYDHARKLEKLYSERIESLLTPIVGMGRVRAIVTADLDFTINEQTEEIFEPDAAQLRSEQINTTPLTEEELAEYTQLAQEAVGFVEERGDSVVVFNRSFQPIEEVLPVEDLPIWEQSWLWNMVRQSLIGLAVLLLVLMVLRPAAKRLMPVAAPVPALADASDEEENDVAAKARADKEKALPSLDPPPVVYGDILNMARAMAAEDPKRVAKVVKDWVAQE